MPSGILQVVSLTSLESGLLQLGLVRLPWFGPISDVLIAPSTVASPMALHTHAPASPQTPASPGGSSGRSTGGLGSGAGPGLGEAFLGLPSAAVLVLTSPGQLHVHDDRGLEAILPCMPLPPPPGAKGAPQAHRQAQRVELSQGAVPEPVAFETPGSAVHAARLVLAPWGSSAARTLKALPWLPPTRAPLVLSHGTKWPISGGRLGSPPDPVPGDGLCLYVSGHESGTVHVSDITSPLLVPLVTAGEELGLSALAQGENDRTGNGSESGSAEAGEGGAGREGGTEGQEKAASSPVTAVDFCPHSGLLAVGHRYGSAQLFELFPSPREILVRVLTSAGSGGTGSGGAEGMGEEEGCPPLVQTRQRHQTFPAGLQCIAHFELHSAPVTAVALATGVARLALACLKGRVSIVDLKTLTVLANCYAAPSAGEPSPVASLAFCRAPAAPAQEAPASGHLKRGSHPTAHREDANSSRPLVLAASASMVLAVLDAESGAVCYRSDLKKTVTGKAQAQVAGASAAALLLLDPEGLPEKDLKGPCVMPWLTPGGNLLPKKAQDTKEEGSAADVEEGGPGDVLSPPEGALKGDAEAGEGRADKSEPVSSEPETEVKDNEQAPTSTVPSEAPLKEDREGGAPEAAEAAGAPAQTPEVPGDAQVAAEKGATQAPPPLAIPELAPEVQDPEECRESGGSRKVPTSEQHPWGRLNHLIPDSARATGDLAWPGDAAGSAGDTGLREPEGVANTTAVASPTGDVQATSSSSAGASTSENERASARASGEAPRMSQSLSRTGTRASGSGTAAGPASPVGYLLVTTKNMLLLYSAARIQVSGPHDTSTPFLMRLGSCMSWNSSAKSSEAFLA